MVNVDTPDVAFTLPVTSPVTLPVTFPVMLPTKLVAVIDPLTVELCSVSSTFEFV